MKKVLSFLLTLAFALCLPYSAWAAEDASYTGEVKPSSVLLMDADTGDIYYEKQADSQIFPASTTKLMTALLTVEQCANLDDTVTVHAADFADIVYGSDSTLDPMLSDGEEISYRDLLYGLMVVSGNDTAMVLANAVGGSTEQFVSMMNQRAQELGMEHTHFVTPHGRHEDDHYTTARDMAKLALEVSKNEVLMEICGTARYILPETNNSEPRTLISSNRLLCDDPAKPAENGLTYPYATGMKTGSTPMAHGCLVASAARGDVHLLCLIFGDESEKETDRFVVARDLFDYGFSKFQSYTGETLLDKVPLSLPKELRKNYEFHVNTEGFTTFSRSKLSPKELQGAIEADPETLSGTATYTLSDGSVLATCPVTLTAVERKAMHPILRVPLLVAGVLLLILAILAALIFTNALLRERRHRAYTKRRVAKGLPPVKPRADETGRQAARRETERAAKMERYLFRMGVLCVTTLLLGVGALKLANTTFVVRPVAETVAEEEELVVQKGVYSAIQPKATEQTSAEAMGITWEILHEGEGDYSRTTPLSFGDPADYFALPGIATFRGNNFRSDATYGTAQVVEKTLSDKLWSSATGSLSTSSGTSSWTGSGWTGQPLMAQWDAQTRQNMNLYEGKKLKDNLVEVIYATLDGHIYFLDLEDGSYTRDPLDLGMCFKGAGALDPRGYPLMYVGSGDETVGGTKPHTYVISLIDGSVLYTFGDYDPDSWRGDNGGWSAFDSSPLVDGANDTLLWPGENGILYSVKLNTVYNAELGTLSVNPDIDVRTRYVSSKSNSDTYWVGYECSADIIDHYLYLSENGGMFYCVDLNTMELVWAQDTKDDSNSSPVVHYNEETGEYAIFTAPSLHWTADSSAQGDLSIYKLNAATGEIMWEYSYHCHTVSGVSGGVQATPLIGRKGSTLENTIVYPLARTPNAWSGELVALDTETGAERWKFSLENYSWSSPVAVYDKSGNAYIVLFDSVGNGFLLDGKTGEQLDCINAGDMVEASPAVFENRLVVGTRGMEIVSYDVQ